MKILNVLMVILCLVRLSFNKSPIDSSKLTESHLDKTPINKQIARSDDTTLLSVHNAQPYSKKPVNNFVKEDTLDSPKLKNTEGSNNTSSSKNNNN